MSAQVDFALAPRLEASSPPESRGVARDSVRMMVAHRRTGEIVHSVFSRLGDFVSAGDLLVVNTSRTLPAAVVAVGGADEPVVVHFSTRLSEGLWVVEPRRPVRGSTAQWIGGTPPSRLAVAEGRSVELVERYMGSDRLWLARLKPGDGFESWLGRNGQAIRYGYVERDWPIEAYQNVYALAPGSAEMPSAGRPMTPELITRLVAKGVGVSPVVLHAGVSSLEAKERPFPEWFSVPATTARRVNATRAEGGRVIAVGTTVVRALESALSVQGVVGGKEGWTDLVITPERGVTAVDGIVTGWHEPEASHLQMLEAIAGRELLDRSYAASMAGGYLWHEFGDSHLILR